ncbi:FtsH protease activity modulator HflK [Parvibaculum sp.]|uniref:FtsH protease activity modulator HflK n=1 Tax=Parvibaculum sp. TaxID=2024848 RepID=UPI002C5FD3D3|nr:FtsH protease activity modulator HflK [Parvibaculum sp.]HUD51254.1 FtsH protease activity modulator HflK [Parvibaculum sp.]
MPWSNQNGGGGWQGGGGGNRGPWGQGPSGGGKQPPDLDELIRRGQDKFREILPGGTGGTRGPILILSLVVLVALVASSVFRVDTDQQGIVLRFGKFVRIEQPGLHFKFPYPIEYVATPTVTRVNRTDIGTAEAGRPSTEEGLMLTGDENIVDISFSVFWRIKDATDYLFKVEEPDRAVKAMAESAMREVVGQSNIQVLLTTGRGEVQAKVRDLMQQALDAYGAGIVITEVKLQKVDPPAAVIDAFRDVQAARADQERLQYEANTYANTVVPKARGAASQITQSADAYRQQIVAEAEGEAKRFLLIYNEYKKAKDVTRRRIYIETMEDVLGGINKVIVDPSRSNGVMPYLPLSGLKPIPPAALSGSSDASGSSSTGSGTEGRP